MGSWDWRNTGRKIVRVEANDPFSLASLISDVVRTEDNKLIYKRGVSASFSIGDSCLGYVLALIAGANDVYLNNVETETERYWKTRIDCNAVPA